MEMIKEYYPESLIKEEKFEIVVEEKPENKSERVEKKVENPIEVPVEVSPQRSREREEILKKYGIKEPPDEVISSILFEYAFQGRNMEDIARELRESIEQGITKIPKIKKSCIIVTAGREGNALEFVVNITAHYSGGLTGKRDTYLEEKMREDLERISTVMAGEISERIGIETKVKCLVDFRVKGLL